MEVKITMILSDKFKKAVKDSTTQQYKLARIGKMSQGMLSHYILGISPVTKEKGIIEIGKFLKLKSKECFN